MLLNKRNGRRQLNNIIASLYSTGSNIYPNERSDFDCNKVEAALSRKKCIEQKKSDENFIYIHIKPVNPIGEEFYRAHSSTNTHKLDKIQEQRASSQTNKNRKKARERDEEKTTPTMHSSVLRTNDDDRKQKRCAKKQFEHFAGIFLLLLCNHNPNLQTIHYTGRSSVFIYWRCSYVMALPLLLLLLLVVELHFSMDNIFRTTTKNIYLNNFSFGRVECCII